MTIKKGERLNPNGRPRGTKNKVPRDLIEKILFISNELDKQGKGLQACAEQQPDWFFEHFIKPVIPKNVDVNLEGEMKITWQK
jgi:hypothetical protein